MATTKPTTDNTNTIKEWLSQLPDGYREQAFHNLDESAANRYVDSLANALINAFEWEDSPEGYDYWNSVCDWSDCSNWYDCALPELK